MNRRQWLKTTGGLSAGCVLANWMPLPGLAEEQPACSWETAITRLKLRHTWTTTMSSSQFRDTLQVRLSSDGVTGVGEGAPIVRYHENAEDGKKAIAAIFPLLQAANPWRFEKTMAEVSCAMPGQFAAKAALDIALMDWIRQKLRSQPSPLALTRRRPRARRSWKPNRFRCSRSKLAWIRMKRPSQ